MPLVYWARTDVWKLTRWRSLVAVKRWATRYHHAWEMKGNILVVSTADGEILRYKQIPSAGERVRDSAPGG